MIRQIGVLMAIGMLVLSSVTCGFSFPGTAVRGSGNIVRAVRDTGSFDQVSVSGGIDLVLTQDGQESVRIEADDNILPYISTEVQGDELVIKYETDGRLLSLRPTQQVTAYVIMVDVRGIGASGGGDVESGPVESDGMVVRISGGGNMRIDGVEAKWLNVNLSGGGGFASDRTEVDALALEVSGGGDADIGNLRADTLTADFSGGGSLRVIGEVKTQEISMSSGGDYRGGELSSEEAVLKISGGGNAQVWVTEELDVSLSGGGSVRYSGNPRVRQAVSGGGTVTGER